MKWKFRNNLIDLRLHDFVSITQLNLTQHLGILTQYYEQWLKHIVIMVILTTDVLHDMTQIWTWTSWIEIFTDTTRHLAGSWMILDGTHPGMGYVPLPLSNLLGAVPLKYWIPEKMVKFQLKNDDKTRVLRTLSSSQSKAPKFCPSTRIKKCIV